MTPQQYERAREIFHAACEMTADQRSTFVAEACRDDRELREEVGSLLDHDRLATGLFESADSTSGSEAPGGQSGEDPLPERVGHYRILSRLGEGGFGVVCLAEQTEPIRRRVALKIIKPGMDTKQVIARFEAERQALAMMDHANVAKVFEAGSTEAGRPYFVMEHVPGASLTEHCDRQRLRVGERLELFTQVCDAIQHAHQKGIIHRDLKPSNVLVTAKDDEAVPKVIDFGVAKALHGPLTEKTLFTGEDKLIGTLEYMSPEQAEVAAQDIDTRTDIYSLGVLLYELLTGVLPFDRTTPRIIREEEPPKPSTRLGNLGEESTANAGRRRAEPKSLARILRGELDWITMKAMEKDRRRRYATASELAADVRRYLGHEPVLAGPPSAVYRVRKYVRRNRRLVSVVAAVLTVSIIAGTALVREQNQRRETDRLELLFRNASDELIVEVFTIVRDQHGADAALSVLDDLARAPLATEPLVQAARRHTIGNMYRRMGAYELAEEQLKRGLTIQRETFGDRHPGTLQLMNDLANVYLGRDQLDEAEDLYQQTLDLRRQVLGKNHRDTLQTKSNLAIVYKNTDRFADAERLVRDALPRQRRRLGEGDRETIRSMGTLANILSLQERFDEAEPLYLEAIEASESALGKEDRDTLAWTYNLADMYAHQGRWTDALPLVRQTLDNARALLPKAHSNIGKMLGTYGSILMELERYPEAEEALLEAHQIFASASLDDEQTETVEHLVKLYESWGRPSEAERWRTLGSRAPGKNADADIQ